jgi:hypothetical protein
MHAMVSRDAIPLRHWSSGCRPANAFGHDLLKRQHSTVAHPLTISNALSFRQALVDAFVHRLCNFRAHLGALVGIQMK